MPRYSSAEGDLFEIRNDEGLCFSDSEKSSKGDELQSEAMKDYWFGKKYFECVLAQKILEENTMEETLTVIDSKFEIAIQDFNYSEGINTLRTFGMKSPQSKLIDREHTTHMDFLSLMGSIVRQASELEQLAIKSAFCATQSTKAFPQHSGHNTSFPGQHHSTEQNGTLNLQTVEPDTPDIALYTMALKEQGDVRGVSPFYIEEIIKLYPPVFKVTVKFQDITSTGSGRSKRLAKHEASKAACRMLNFKVL